LKALKAQHPSPRSITVKEGDANAALQEWLASGIDWSRHRSVVFLDPFGMQVPWSTIEALAKTKAMELIINFPLGMAIQRLLPKSGNIPPGWQMSLDTFFGSPEWRGLAYEEGADLFGPKCRWSADRDQSCWIGIQTACAPRLATYRRRASSGILEQAPSTT
jgi:three-Cys-motif partner protein